MSYAGVSLADYRLVGQYCARAQKYSVLLKKKGMVGLIFIFAWALQLQFEFFRRPQVFGLLEL